MSFDALKKNNTKFLFQLAGVFGIIYFILRAEALRILIPFLDLIDIHAYESSLPWWLPVWPLDRTFLSQPAYGAGAPIMAISFALALMALAGLLWNIKGKNLENNRSMVVAAIVSTTLLLVTSIVFIIYAFPDLETGRVNPIPEGSHLPLYILFVVTAILSITTFASLAFNLVKSRKLSIWAGIALVFGIVIVNINWFSVLSLSFDFIGNFYWLVMLFGLGWGLGLWQLSKAAKGEKVEHQWPRIHWRKLAVGGGVFVGLWVLFIGSIFAWDATQIGPVCQGEQIVTDAEGGSQEVIYQGENYQFTYVVSEELPWVEFQGRKHDDNNELCGIATRNQQAWTHNRGLHYLPFGHLILNKVYESDDTTVATFSIRKTEPNFDSIDELYADYEHRKEVAKELEERGKARFRFENTTPTIAEVDGKEALRFVRQDEGFSNFYSEAIHVIHDGTHYVINWSVSAPTVEERDAYLLENKEAIEVIVDSIQFK